MLKNPKHQGGSAALHPHPCQPDPRVREVEDLMRRDLLRTLRLGELARASDLSVSRLAHLFKANTGLSPGRYLKLVRLFKARDLLEDSSFTVKEISARVGFDPSRLAREFRTNYGVTPVIYRRALHMPQRSSGNVYRRTQTPV